MIWIQREIKAERKVNRSIGYSELEKEDEEGGFIECITLLILSFDRELEKEKECGRTLNLVGVRNRMNTMCSLKCLFRFNQIGRFF